MGVLSNPYLMRSKQWPLNQRKLITLTTIDGGSPSTTKAKYVKEVIYINAGLAQLKEGNGSDF